MRNWTTVVAIVAVVAGSNAVVWAQGDCPATNNSNPAPAPTAARSDTPSVPEPHRTDAELKKKIEGAIDTLKNQGVVNPINTNANAAELPQIDWVVATKTTKPDVAVVTGDVPPPAEATPAPADENVYLSEEVKKAVPAGQPILLFVIQADSKDVEKMEQNFFSDAKVVEAMNKFARLKIELQNLDKDMAKKYGVSGAPAMVVMLSSGKVVQTVTSTRMASRTFLTVLEQVQYQESQNKK